MSEKKSKSESLQEEVREKMKQYIGAGFGLVAGLAWNDAIKALIEYLFPLEKNSLTAKLIYAIAMTLVVVFVGLSLSKFLRKRK